MPALLHVLAPWDAGDGAGLGALLLLLRRGESLAGGGLDQGGAFGLLVLVVVILVAGVPGLVLGVGGEVLEGELLVVALAGHGHLDGAPVLQLAEQQLVGQRLLDVLLDDAGERPGAELLVVALLRQ